MIEHEGAVGIREKEDGKIEVETRVNGDKAKTEIDTKKKDRDKEINSWLNKKKKEKGVSTVNKDIVKGKGKVIDIEKKGNYISVEGKLVVKGEEYHRFFTVPAAKFSEDLLRSLFKKWKRNVLSSPDLDSLKGKSIEI